MTLIMEGYDIALLGAFFAQPAFLWQCGTLEANGKTYQIPAASQAGLLNGARAGEIFGSFLDGYRRSAGVTGRW